MGNFPRRRVVNVILTARNAHGVLALVVFEDGRYGITRDGQPLPQHHWPADRLEECIDVFMELSAGKEND